jgi:hypothetical protein
MKILDKVGDLVLLKAKSTPEQQVKELDEQIEDLKKKRQLVLDGVNQKYVSKMLSRIMHEWVIVGGWCEDDERPLFHGQHYSIYKVAKAIQWEGGNSFRIIATNLMYLSAEGELNGGIYRVDTNRRIKDIGNLSVIPASKALSIIRKARKVVNKHLDKALKEAQGDI